MASKQILVCLTLAFLSSSAFATARADRQQTEAPVLCTTRGVSPFQDHMGGFQIRLDPSPDRSDFVNGTFWRVSPGMADGLLKSTLGRELLNLEYAREPNGECHLRLNQVADPDNNQMNLDITINAADPSASSARLSMYINGRPIRPSHGNMNCAIQSADILSAVLDRCQTGDKPRNSPSPDENNYYEIEPFIPGGQSFNGTD